MRAQRLLRLFWLAAAAALVAGAAVALVAVLSGSFDDTDGKILATLGTALLAGATAVAGRGVAETTALRATGNVLTAVAPILFAVAAAGIWGGGGDTMGRSLGTAYVLMLASLLLSTNRLIVGSRRDLSIFFGATAGLLAVTTPLTVLMIWTGGRQPGVKTLASLWILTVLAYLLTPVARRLATPEEVAATRKVDLRETVRVGDADVRALAPEPGRRRSRSDLLYVVVTGRLSVGDLDAGPGEAILAPRGVEHEPHAEPGSLVLVVGAPV